MTTKELRKFIESMMEDETIPREVLKWVEKMQSKKVRANNLPAGYKKKIIAGMTYLQENWFTSITTDHQFLLSYDTVNVVCPSPNEFKEHNTCYYKGRQERNTNRLDILNDHAALSLLAKKITQIRVLRSKFNVASKELDDMLEIGDGYSADRYEVRELTTMSE